jgi:hypothetical protein
VIQNTIIYYNGASCLVGERGTMKTKAIKIYPEEKKYPSSSGCGATYSVWTHEVWLGDINAEVEEIDTGKYRISFTRGRTAYDRPIIFSVGQKTYQNMISESSSRLLDTLDDDDDLDWEVYAAQYGLPCIYYGSDSTYVCALP